MTPRVWECLTLRYATGELTRDVTQRSHGSAGTRRGVAISDARGQCLFSEVSGAGDLRRTPGAWCPDGDRTAEALGVVEVWFGFFVSHFDLPAKEPGRC